jgi:hypothetical protein
MNSSTRCRDPAAVRTRPNIENLHHIEETQKQYVRPIECTVDDQHNQPAQKGHDGACRAEKAQLRPIIAISKG